MKKTLLLVVALIIVVIGASVYYVLTNLDGLVKQAIEKYGSETTHTMVQVKAVNIHLQQAAASISGLTVGNPSGFSSPNAFSLGQISLRLDLKHTDKQHIAIDEVNVQAPQVFYEINAARQGNLNLLKDNLTGTAEKAKSGVGKPQSAALSVQPIIAIHKFVFAGAALHAMVVPLNDKHYELKLPPFQLLDLHGTPQQITRQVLNQLLDRAREAIRKKGIDAELNKLRSQVRQKAANEKAKLKQKMNTRLEQEKTKAEDKLKSLFGK